MTAERSVLRELQDWYQSECNETWEHKHGVEVSTLDNPGWTLKIDLTDTALQDRPFTPRSYGVSPDGHPEGDDWLVCKVEGQKFTAAGGPQMTCPPLPYQSFRGSPG
jgi:hypothetical protein